MVLVPLVSWQGVFFPHTMAKTALFRVLVEAALVFWAPLAVMDASYRPRANVLTISIAAFFGVLFLTSVTGINFQKSVWSDYERMMGLWTYAHVVAFFFMTTSVVRAKERWQILWYLTLATAAFVGIYGVVENIVSPEGRITATIGNAGFLAAYLLLHIFIGIALLTSENRMSYRAWGVGAAVMLMGLALVLTEARASVSGLGAGGVALLLIFLIGGEREGSTLSLPNRMLKRAAAFVLILSLLVVLGATLFRSSVTPDVPQPISRLVLVDYGERTASGRLNPPSGSSLLA